MNEIFDMKNFLPEKIITSSNTTYPCNYQIYEKFISANFIANVTNQYKGIHGKRKHEQNLPRYLPLNQTFKVIGVLKAEMSTGKNNGKIQFCNSEPEIIRIALNWFKKFEIKENGWTWRLTFNKKLKLNESEEKIKMRELAARDFWIKETKLSLSKLAKTWVRYCGTEEGQMKADSPLWGSVTIEGGNSFLRALIVGFIKKISKNIEKLSAKEASLYLDGFFSGEGCFHKGKREILIPIKDNEERLRTKATMKKLNFDIDNDINCRQIKAIRTGGVKDLFIAYKLGLFKMNPTRRIKLLENLLNIQRFFMDAKPLKKEIKNIKPEIEREHQQLEAFLNQRKRRFELLRQDISRRSEKNRF